METTYRLVGFCGGRERVVASGLTREQGEAKLQYLRAHPMRGMSFCLENEAAAQAWERNLQATGLPHPAPERGKCRRRSG